MPVRATKRGAERTPLEGSHDVVICGASFAGLAVARELAGSGADVLIVDRYEIGERQTSACAAPLEWLTNLGLGDSVRQEFGELVIHTPLRSFRWTLPWRFCTFDYPQLCALLWAQAGAARFETATVSGRSREGSGHVIHTDRGDLRAPLVVDALGWRRVLSRASAIQPPEARLSRGLEVHPGGAGEDFELWLDPSYIRAGYSWSFPAGDELRVGVGSFDPRDHVREPTVRLAGDLGLPDDGYQGNWIPHQMRDATEDEAFFAGDSAGHCLPATAEGIRPALYFGLACGRELRHVVDGRQTRAQALTRYRALHEDRRFAWRWLLHTQRAIGALNPHPAMTSVAELMSHRAVIDRAFARYLDICPPPEPMAPASAAA
jgi:flavin-dependent dehydrogenase